MEELIGRSIRRSSAGSKRPREIEETAIVDECLVDGCEVEEALYVLRACDMSWISFLYLSLFCVVRLCGPVHGDFL